MSDTSLLSQIVGVLSRSREDLSASDIARAVGCKRSEINSVLYRYKGEKFRSSSESKPKWNLLDPVVPPQARPDRVSLPSATKGPIHIDFQGGDWEIEILYRDSSRNDPPFTVERVGERRRIITVSTAFVPEATSEGRPSSALVVMAASALVWEIANDRGLVDQTDFDWGIASRDVLLSLVAHNLDDDDGSDRIARRY